MSNYYSNPTANAAIGTVDREIRQKTKLARRYKRLRRSGPLSPAQEARVRQELRGIFRPLLKIALEEDPFSPDPEKGKGGTA